MSSPIRGQEAPSSSRRTEGMERVEGKVLRTTTARRGEIDGVILDDGTWVHWPPHLGDEFSPLAKVGQRIDANGRKELNKEGEEWFETFRLINLGSKASFERDEMPPPPRHGHRPPPPGERGRGGPGGFESIEGTIKSFTTAPKGETDGAVLSDGRVIHWPPHRQDDFANVASVGDRVRIEGRSKRAPHGEFQIEVDSLEKLDGKSTASAAKSDPTESEAKIRRLEERLERIEAKLTELLGRQK